MLIFLYSLLKFYTYVLQFLILKLKNMKQEYLEAAEVINQAYKIPSTFDWNTKYAYFMVFDDDITAVLKSIYVYRQLKKRNPEMKYVVVGGEGLLAIAFKVMRFSLWVRGNSYALSRLKKETEAARLKRVAMALLVREEDIIVLDKGHNTTENLQAMSNLANGKKSLVVSTQRLAMVFKQSAEFQCNQHPEKFGCRKFDYDMYVIEQTVEEVLRWYNFQAAGDGRVALHLFASLVRRFEVYDGKFLTKPFEPDDEVKKADALLRPEFVIKQHLGGFGAVRAIIQYIPIVWDIFHHPMDYINDETLAIEDAALCALEEAHRQG